MRDYWTEFARAAVVGAILLAVLLTVFGPRLRALETQIWWLQLMGEAGRTG